jgi:hypothetical protein
VPWCDTCDRFLSPSTVTVGGTCPRCGGSVDAGHAHPAVASDPVPVESPALVEPEDDELGPLPWHLKLLAGAVAVYLGYRALQGIEWVLGR